MENIKKEDHFENNLNGNEKNIQKEKSLSVEVECQNEVYDDQYGKSQ